MGCWAWSGALRIAANSAPHATAYRTRDMAASSREAKSLRLSLGVRVLGPRKGEQPVDFLAVHPAVALIPEQHHPHGGRDEQPEYQDHRVDLGGGPHDKQEKRD